MEALIQDFRQLLQDSERCQAIARDICERHQLVRPCVRLNEGSQLVFSTADGWIIKVFAPEDSEFHQAERVFLAGLENQLPIATPAMRAHGVWHNLPYLVMSRLDGKPLNRVWASLDQAARLEIVAQLGRAVRALHQLSPSRFEGAPFDWTPFIDQQIAQTVERHRTFGLGTHWLDQLDDFMSTFTVEVHDPRQLVPLHTELMLEHVFVTQHDDQWKVCGLIDFEPAMIGHREYELAAVGLFITPGQPQLFRQFLRAYGGDETDLNAEFSRRVMQWMLLHRYGNLNRFMKMVPHHETFTELDQFVCYWFGV